MTTRIEVNCQTGEQTVVELTNAEITAAAANAPPPLTYVELRRREYPAMGEQLDALWKGGADADAMRSVVMAVKAKYPKP